MMQEGVIGRSVGGEDVYGRLETAGLFHAEVGDPVGEEHVEVRGWQARRRSDRPYLGPTVVPDLFQRGDDFVGVGRRDHKVFRLRLRVAEQNHVDVDRAFPSRRRACETFEIRLDQPDFPLVVARSPGARSIPVEHDMLRRRRLLLFRHFREIMDGEVDLPVVGLFHQHVLLFDVGQGDDQVFGERHVAEARFGDETVAPPLEGEVRQPALCDLRLGPGLDDLHAQRKLAQFVLEVQRQMVGRVARAADELRDVLHPDRSGPAGGDGKHAGLEVVALGPFDEARINPPADDLLEHLAALVLLDGHAVDHLSLDVEGVAADGRALRQGEVEVAFHHAT